MALDTDLAVDQLLNLVHTDLGERIPALDAFSINAAADLDRVLTDADTTGVTYQVESTGTLPTAGDDPTSWETGSGTNTNIAVTANNIVVRQEITAKEQSKGIPFNTAISAMNQSLRAALWDKVTPLIVTGTYGASVSGGAAGSFSQANAKTMRANVDATVCNLLVEHSESDDLYPSDKDQFDFRMDGGWGYDAIYAVSNFTGATANTMAFACNPSAIVTVQGRPVWDGRMMEILPMSEIVEPITIQDDDGSSTQFEGEFHMWRNSDTKSLWMAIACVFGAAAGDAAAGTMATHL